MKFRPQAWCRMRISPGPGSPTGRSTSCISSGPPRRSMRIVGLVDVVMRVSDASGCAIVPALPQPRSRRIPMKRLTTAPNLALATLWADLLSHAGMPTTRAAPVREQHRRRGAAGPDAARAVGAGRRDQFEQARVLLHELRHPPSRRWVCPGCGEQIDGPFEQCWKCGARCRRSRVPRAAARRSRPAGDLLWYPHNFAAQSEWIPLRNICWHK